MAVPTVSIGMVAYNGERFIRQAVDSLLAQTFRDFELIISDDASTDGTEAICRDYAVRDARIRYIRQPVNLRAAANFDFVLAQARGPFCMWASDDDLWEPGFIERLLALLEAHPEAVLAAPAFDVIDAEGRHVRGMERDWGKVFARDHAHAARRCLAEASGGDLPVFLYGLVRTDALRATGAYAKAAGEWDVYGGADVNIVTDLILRGPFVMEPRVLFHKRLGAYRGDYPDLHGIRQKWRTFRGYEQTRRRLCHEAIRESPFGGLARMRLHLAAERRSAALLAHRLRASIWPSIRSRYLSRPCIFGAARGAFRRVARLFGFSRARRMPPPYADWYGRPVGQWMNYAMAELFEKGRVAWMGVPAWKCPLDLWIYQEIVHSVRPDVIVEIGSYNGGTTLYLAHLCDILGNGSVISVDIDRSRYCVKHPRIVEVTGDSASPEVIRRVSEHCRGRKVMVIQDGAHDAASVTKDLNAYADLVSPGSYFIVEDATVDIFAPDQPLGRNWRGPLPAIEDFLRRRQDYVMDEDCERFRITYAPRGFLKRVGPAPLSATSNASGAHT